MKKWIFLFLLSAVTKGIVAQDRLVFSFEYPLQYELSYHHVFEEIQGPSIGLGLLTAPFDEWIIDDLEQNGTDEEIIRLLRESTRRGIILNLGYRLEHEGFFLEPRYQWAHINAENSTLNVVLEFYELEDLIEVLELLGFQSLLESPVTMRSQLHQFALRLGYNWDINEKWGLQFSAGGSIYLNSKASFDSRLSRIDEVRELEEQLVRDLNNAYKTGAYFYTLSLGIYRRL